MALDLSESAPARRLSTGAGVVCSLFLLFAIVDFVYVMHAEDLRQAVAWFPPVIALLSVVQMAGIIAAWERKPWGAGLHLGAAGVALACCASIGLSPVIEVVDQVISLIIRRSPFFGYNRYMPIALAVIYLAMNRRLNRG